MPLPALHRYFLRQFGTYFLILTAGLSLFFTGVHLVDRLDDLMPYQPGPLMLGLYLLFLLPKYILYLLPMATLICVILTFALATKRKEIIAFKASGGDIRMLLIPFLIAGALISLADMLLSEVIVPAGTRTSTDLVYRLKEETERPRFREGEIWTKGAGGNILHAETYLPDEKAMRNVTLFGLAESRLSTVLVAEQARWRKGAWMFQDATRYDIARRSVTRAGDVTVEGFADPRLFATGIPSPDEMGIRELLAYRARLGAAGYRNKKLDVDILARVLYPVTCLFMMVLGLALSLRKDLRSGIVGVAAGVIVSLVYWLVHTFMLSLGYAGVIPPLASAGSAPLVFGAVSFALLRKVPG